MSITRIWNGNGIGIGTERIVQYSTYGVHLVKILLYGS